MDTTGKIGLIVVSAALIAAIFLICYGAFNNAEGYVTTGVGIISTALGYVLGKYFGDVVNNVRNKLK